MRIFIVFFLILPILTGCGASREEKNSQLIKGCEAAAGSILSEDGISISNLASSQVLPSEFGDNYWQIKINASTKSPSSAFTEPKEISCVFFEAFGPFGIGYRAEFIQLNIEGRIIGKDKEGAIQGTVPEFMALTDKVTKALR